jgi:plasmid stabilization system protein ParE
VADVSLHVCAEAEYEAALAWYLERSVRAAAGFEAAFESAIGFLAAFPEACPLRDERHRCCCLRRYPYGLVYRVDGDQVRVIAVAHNRQLPGYWAAGPDDAISKCKLT